VPARIGGEGHGVDVELDAVADAKPTLIDNAAQEQS